MIELSNGHKIKYVAASGALKFNGKGWLHERLLLSPWKRLFDPSLFTAVIKTVTREPRRGNFRSYWPWGCIRPIFRDGNIVGIVNAVGLTNPGIDWFCREVGSSINPKKIALVGSILSDDTDELVEMARMLNPFNFIALEMNESCPNTKKDLLRNTEKIPARCEAVKKVSRFPLILKLSVVHDIKLIFPGIEGIIEAIDINSVPWEIIFPDKKSPLAHLGGGGVSGEIAQPHTWGFVKRLIDSTDIPVIGPSVWDYEDMQKLRDIGAKAISFGSVFLRYPWRPTQFVKKDMKRNQN